jgi:hypothetical protein
VPKDCLLKWIVFGNYLEALKAAFEDGIGA